MKNIITYKSIKKVFLLSMIFFPLTVFSEESEGKKGNESRNNFLKIIKKAKKCITPLNEISLSLQRLDLDLKENNICNQNLNTSQKIDECVNYKQSLLNEIQKLELKINRLREKERCGYEGQRRDSENLDDIESKIYHSRLSINVFLDYFDGLKKDILEKRERNFNRSNILKMCYRDYRAQRRFDFEDSDKLFAGNKAGDWYEVKRKFHKKRLFLEYSEALFKACGFDEEDSALNEKELYTKKRFTRSLSKHWEVLESYRVIYEGADLKEMGAKICESLKQKKKDKFGICENREENDSWFYSAHYLLNKE